ncbi:AAA domain-containing protein [Paenibacillus sp. FSL M8-0334]|uniref:AAA family ATPase n=2 Tax=Paenibacillus TaxID=44249 RepID=A0ABW9T9B7_9BACL|nr:AAA domain-containing protein [Paenibacillus campinasensis]MUG68899.1 AAA family ATPase [Paenibacillus campinasensis]
MDQERFMIIVKGEDKTQDVSSYEKDPPIVRIVYKGSSKVYTYQSSDVQLLTPTIQDITEDTAVFHEGYPFYNVERVLDFGQRVRVCFNNGSIRTYDRERIQIRSSSTQNAEGRKILDYWREISKYAKSEDEQENKGTFLAKQFANLNYVDPDSALSHYLLKKPIKSDIPVTTEPIFPFRYNLSQRTALEQSLKSTISIIEGPPGTGKTQTILNILANLAVMQGKKIAVVSGNNAAVLNVQEKMERHGYHFFVASLGKQENKKKFFANLPNWDVSEWSSDVPEDELNAKLQELNQRIHRLMELDREKAQLRQKLSAYLLEQEHFEHYYARQDIQPIEKWSFYRQTPKRILEFMKDSFLAVEVTRKYKFLYQFKLFFRHGFTDFKRLKEQGLDVILNVQREFYTLKVEELSDRIQKLEKELEAQDYQALMNQHQQLSETLFRHRLHEKYHNRPAVECNEKTYTYSNKFKTFIEHYPIVLSTTHSLRNCIPANYLFDYCIIDESSQVDLLTGALALSCCKQAIIVGDTKQLPHIVEKEIEHRIQNHTVPDMDEAYDYIEHNLLSSMLALYGDSVPKVMLREHYRCHPQIIEFCNRKYYDGELIAFTDPGISESPLLIYKTSPGNHMREVTHGKKGKFNARELDVIEQEILLGYLEAASGHEDIGFVTPYRKQVEKATEQFTIGIESDTIHKYQGREKSVMIMSTVLDRTRAGGMGMRFVNDPCMINVAVSRAQARFILVTDQSAFHKYGNEVGDLMRYMEYSTMDDNVVESEIHSVFDLLYKEYSDNLQQFRERVRFFNKSRHRSENIMHALLDEMLQEPMFKDFELGNQILLMNLFTDLERLDEEERKFVKQRSSVDFVIYHKLDRSLALAIEVDGFAFHENNPEQLKRDKKKEEIFKKFGIELARFRTNESGEEQRIRELLNSMLY